MTLPYIPVWREGQKDIGLGKGKYKVIFGGVIPDWFPDIDWTLPKWFPFRYANAKATRLEVYPEKDEATVWVEVFEASPGVVAVSVLAAVIAAALFFGYLSVKEIRKSVPMSIGFGAVGLAALGAVFFLKGK